MLYTYSARDITITLTNLLYGSHQVTGLGPEDFLTIETGEDDWNEEVSAGGEDMCRSLLPNVIGNATLTLQFTSLTNRYLTNLRNQDRLTPGAGLFGIKVTSNNTPIAGKVGTVLDGLGTDAFTNLDVNCGTCYVKKLAPMSMGKTAQTRAWPITMHRPLFPENEAQLALALGTDVASFGQTLTNL